MSYPNLQFAKNRGLQNSLSLSKKRSAEIPLITTPNLLDLQLNLPDPLNRPTFSLVRGVKVPNSYTQPSVTYYHPPSQPLTKTQHTPKPQVPFQTPLPHRQYTAPEFGSRQKLLIATNNTQTQARPHSQHQPQRSSIASTIQSIDDAKKRHEEKIQKYTRDSMLSESADFPGIPVIYRSDEIKRLSPDRLNLEGRHLTVMPIFEKEEQLRLLNLQMNMISRIQHISTLRNLIFLDLYDNLISEMTGLDSLVSLRVLMLGKNRIKAILGLENLRRLDVLDLHGNMIQEIKNIETLLNLRVLNLAGNEITVVCGLENLKNLTELNFRRNKITSIMNLSELTLLQRLFLAHNQIADIENFNNCIYCSSLQDLTLDNNPIQHNALYKPMILRRCPTLRHLDGAAVNEDERKSVLTALKKLEARKDEENRQVLMKARREQTLISLKEKFFSLHPQLRLEDPSFEQTEDELPNQEVADCIYEISGDSIRFYGEASLEYLEKTHPQGIREIVLSFIDFESFLPYIQRLKTKLPDVKNIEFYYNNITSLNQINALEFIGLELNELNISPQGNPVTSFHFFRDYVKFRLQHLKLKVLNQEVISGPHCPPLFLLQTHTYPINPSTIKEYGTQENSNSLGYLNYCTEKIPETYPKQLREANRITQQVLTNSVRNKNRDEWFLELWPKIFSEAIQENLKEMRDLESFTNNHLPQ